MGYLAGKTIYLSGPIQFSDNIDWRFEPIKYFESLGMRVYSPFDDEKQKWAPIINKAAEENDFETVTKIAKSFVRKDMALVDRSDMLCAYIPANSRTFGTTHEIINANQCKKPVMIVSDSVASVPFWFFGFIPYKRMFGSWQSLFDYLAAVENGLFKDDNRWAYVYGLV